MAPERAVERELVLVRDTERNHWMSAEQALAYGLVGRIIESAAELSA